MPEPKEPPAYIGEEAPLPVPPIQVLTEEPPKSTSRFPKWLLILLGTCLVLSIGAVATIMILSNKQAQEEAAIVPTQPAVVTVIVSPTPNLLPSKAAATAAPKKLYSNTQFGYSFEVPASWTLEEETARAWLFDSAAPSKNEPQPYMFGRVIVGYDDTSIIAKVVDWFDQKYPVEDKSATKPVKKKLYINSNKVETLETETSDPEGQLTYFFIANTQVVVLKFNITQDPVENAKLQVIYGKIIDSIKVFEPSS